jgi:hypothetical protein
MRLSPDFNAYPLFSYFLSGYLSKSMKDDLNFPPDQPCIFDQYEQLFHSVLQVLDLTKEALRSRPEFNFDSGDAKNLESGIAMLRVVDALRLEKFLNIALLKPSKNAPGADISCERNGRKVCVEVKTITKQSHGRPKCFFEDQMYEKMLESLPKARKQLEATARKLRITVKIFACVVNWLAQSTYLDQDHYQGIVNKLERNQDCESLKGVEGVFFITGRGQQHLFLNERGHRIVSILRQSRRRLIATDQNQNPRLATSGLNGKSGKGLGEANC